MTIRDIVKDWLISHGYDGLCDFECGCGVDDLMPCDEPSLSCVPAYRATRSNCAPSYHRSDDSLDIIYVPAKERINDKT